ncbi:hypothetical protein J3R30DRAFT_348018 [Lentinula aciculospora]|uniref:Uncharacterized protein n=1 Tax=Lentinula aciculospora TaxID=153920 RepID=A0A9W9DLZ8_9AGAR|nr:hypothetical protein J3R30DRAFT_348018 [Lentinula aciculospora]
MHPLVSRHPFITHRFTTIPPSSICPYQGRYLFRFNKHHFLGRIWPCRVRSYLNFPLTGRCCVHPPWYQSKDVCYIAVSIVQVSSSASSIAFPWAFSLHNTILSLSSYIFTVYFIVPLNSLSKVLLICILLPLPVPFHLHISSCGNNRQWSFVHLMRFGAF